MIRVTIHAAKTQLSKLIRRAQAGEEIVIVRGKEPVARLVPVAGTGRRRVFGAMRGRAPAMLSSSRCRPVSSPAGSGEGLHPTPRFFLGP